MAREQRFSQGGDGYSIRQWQGFLVLSGSFAQ
jgi:hypothetical protein